MTDGACLGELKWGANCWSQMAYSVIDWDSF